MKIHAGMKVRLRGEYVIRPHYNESMAECRKRIEAQGHKIVKELPDGFYMGDSEYETTVGKLPPEYLEQLEQAYADRQNR